MEKIAFLKKLGAQVKKVRTQRGYSQDRLCLEGDLSRATMSRIEAGLVDPQSWTLKRIADTIDVPLKKFFEFE